MTFQETEKVALKSIVQEDIKKEILAFANCNGGTVYVVFLITGKSWD